MLLDCEILNIHKTSVRARLTANRLHRQEENKRDAGVAEVVAWLGER